MRVRLVFGFLALFPVAAGGQTLEDGVLFSRHALRTDLAYRHESWSNYWEGTLQRVNGNIGTVTTQSMMVMGGYGITDRLSVMALLPYVWTNASQGPLHGMSGIQDFTVAAKYRLLSTPLTDAGTITAIIVGAGGVPASNYTPDFQPLSIGFASKALTGRFTLNFLAHAGWFANASAGYTWRGNVTLDRPAYYTNGQLYSTNEVAMPAVFDYAISAGFQRGRLCIPLSFSQHRTLGGSDIRRQDMPFVSNRMDFDKVDGTMMYTLTSPRELGIRFGASQIVTGRNVGEATAVTAGLFYTFHL